MIRTLVGLGVSADQSHAEQRRVRTINVVSLFAFFATAFFAVLFLPSRPANIPIWTYLGLSVVYLAGYAATLATNRIGYHDRAVVVLLTTGVGNIVGASVTVGFRAGPAVFLVTVAIGGVLLTRVEHRMVRWVFVTASAVAYAALVLIDPPVAESIRGDAIVSVLVAASYAGMIAFVVTVVWYQRRFADNAEDALTEANERSERLLLNILPSEIAQRLKDGEYPIADRKPAVTVLFADIVGSTAVAEQLSAADLVATLDGLFSAFDDIADRHGLEKIKTIGDNYFAVAGLSDDRDHTKSAAEAALRMRGELDRHHFPGIGQVHMRFGLHTGTVIAGVIGKRKFSYDVWGDTVNTAARMESQGVPGEIQVTAEVRNQLSGLFDFEKRGKIEIRGKGSITTYFLRGRH